MAGGTIRVGWRLLAAAACSGILLGASFPPSPLGSLAFGALVPLLWVLAQPLEFSHVVQVGYIFGFCYHGVANWWVSSWQSEADPYLLIAGLALWLGHPLFFLLPLVGAWWVGQYRGRHWGIRVFPVFWGAFEWLHSLGEIGYPWLTVGYTQAENIRWIQVVDLAGIWGASFLVLWANVALFELLRAWVHAPSPSLWRWIRRREILQWVGLHLAAVGFPLIYGSIRLEQLRAVPAERVLRAVLVQPALNPWAKWERDGLEQIGIQQRLSDSVLAFFAADVVIWNETAIPVPVTLPEYRWLWEGLQAWVRNHGVALLSGFAELRLYQADAAPRLSRTLPWDSTQFYEAYNAAFLLAASGELAGVHRKIRLTPFAERFPYAEFFGTLTRWFEWGVGISAWAKGAEQQLLRLPRRQDTVSLGIAICIESIFSDFARRYAQQGCDVLVVISNDAWFDHTPGPAQHFALARVRALELRRPVLRCANSGITAAVLPTGEVLAQLPQYISAALPVVLPLGHSGSLYQSIGDALPQALTAVSCLLLAAVGLLRRFSAKSR